MPLGFFKFFESIGAARERIFGAVKIGGCSHHFNLHRKLKNDFRFRN